MFRHVTVCAVAALSAAIGLLGGCSQQPEIVQTNHRAVDRLMSVCNRRESVPRDARILGTTFVDIDCITESSTLGRLIGQMAADRLSQRGYTVVEARMRANSLVVECEGEFLLSRDARNLCHEFKAEYALVGVYKKSPDVVIKEPDPCFMPCYVRTRVKRGALYVCMRLIKANDNSVVAAWDYNVRADRDISAIATPVASLP